MKTEAEITDQAIFADTSRITGAALERTRHEDAQATGAALVRDGPAAAGMRG